MYRRLTAFKPPMPDTPEDLARTPDTLPLKPPQGLAEPPAPAPEEPQVLEAPLSLEVRFEPPPGEPARSSLSVELRCDAPGALIRYEVGADLDESSPTYEPGEPIHLTRSSLITARAWHEGAEGPIASASYEIVKALWEQREPEDQSDPIPHEATLDFRFGDSWRACAASARGKLHAHRGLWREDSFAIEEAAAPSGTWAILVVADGAGSASLSRVGSRLACQSTVESLQASLGDQQLSEDAGLLKSRDLPALREKLVQSARSALQVLGVEAEARAKPLNDFATTLLILVRCAWKGQQICASLQVGDGAIALLNADGLMTILGEADHGEHSSETRFLTTPGIEDGLAARTRFSIRSGLKAVAVMSDGVSDDFFPEEQRLPAMLAHVLPLVESEEEGGAALLRWLGYEKKGSSDDRTLVLGWRAQDEPASTCEATDAHGNAAAEEEGECGS